MSAFQIVVEAEQCNDGPQKNIPLAENENPDRIANKKQFMYQSTKRRKGIEVRPIAVDVEARAEVYRGGGAPPEKIVIHKGEKLYRPSIPSTYKEI